MLKLCEYYDCDMLKEFSETDNSGITYEELEIIKKYRNLDDHGREMVDFTLEKEYERSKALEEQNGNNIVNMPSHLEVNAAHHSHGGFTDEEHQEDEDMLD